LYAQNAKPVISLLALEGIAALSRSLPKIGESPSDLVAQSNAQYGAWLCSLCLGSVGVALHHKLCHALAGSFNLPHAETHTIVLPHTLAYNAPNIPEVMAKLANVLPGSNGDPIAGVNLLLETLKVKRALKDFGFREEDIDKATDIAIKSPYYNPRRVDQDLIRELIRRAYAGEQAKADL
jgi:alcohol dehydrogenase class IV